MATEFIDESITRILTISPRVGFESSGVGFASPGVEQMPPRRIAKEIYDAVDLDVACSPVLPPGTLVPHGAVKQENGLYTVDGYPSMCGQLPDTFNVEPAELKLWRARYLVIRDMLYQALQSGEYRRVCELGFHEIYRNSVRDRIIAAYFPKGLVLFKRESAIGEFLSKPPAYVFADGSVSVEATAMA